MNGLSWLIYASEVASGLRSAAQAGVFISLVGMIPLVGVYAIVSDGWPWDDDETKARRKTNQAALLWWIKRAPLFALAFSVIATVSPSRETIMLIAASQAGEQILALEEVQNAGGEVGALATDSIRLLRQMVSEQLEPSE